MDYDADGILDFISGSYDPGDVYLFRGLGKGRYAARELLRDENDVPLVHHPEDLVVYHRLQKAGKKADENGKEAVYYRIASFGSWPATVDWDADGDLDMLIGSFGGRLFLRLNKGSREEPCFAAESIPVDAGGAPMKVNGHLAPVVADWDGDGRWDVVAGAADGSVCWFRNTGSESSPEFAAGSELLPARSSNKFLSQYLEGDEQPARGTRSQICVTDYDGDGKLDLLVGDYSDVYRLRPDLSAEEREQLAAVENEKERRTFYTQEGRQSFVWLFRRR